MIGEFERRMDAARAALNEAAARTTTATALRRSQNIAPSCGSSVWRAGAARPSPSCSMTLTS